MNINKIVNGEIVEITQNEIEELTALQLISKKQKTIIEKPTKEELLAQLQVLTAQINTLE